MRRNLAWLAGMKQFFSIAIATLLTTTAATAAESLVPASDASINLAAALGKQVNVRFSDGFVKGRLAKADFDGLVISDAPEGKLCLFGKEQGLDPEAKAMAGFGRKDEGDVCVPRQDVTIRVTPQDVTGAPPVPFYSTDKKSCAWMWKTGNGIAVWTEDCTFDTGRWTIKYDAENDWFALEANGEDPYPVLRQFRKAGGPQALLPDLKAKGLVLDDKECVFAPSTDQIPPPGWTAWVVVPTGKRKANFDALPEDEVPDPPCGDLGMAVDFVGFFMVQKDHPDRIVYVNLGQDGTMIDLGSVTFTN